MLTTNIALQILDEAVTLITQNLIDANYLLEISQNLNTDQETECINYMIQLTTLVKRCSNRCDILLDEITSLQEDL